MVGIESHQTDISMSSPTRQMPVETDRVTHIQERKPLSIQTSVDDEPPMACLSPPPNDDLLSTSVSIKQEFSPIQDLNRLPSQTGTWPSLRTRSQSQADSSPPPTTTSSPSETVTLTSFGRRTSLLPASPTTSSATTPSSPIGTNSTSRTESEVAGPSVMRLSPLPTNRKPVEKKKTQTLACTFCRHRKVSCAWLFCAFGINHKHSMLMSNLSDRMRSSTFWNDGENVQVSIVLLSVPTWECMRLSLALSHQVTMI